MYYYHFFSPILILYSLNLLSLHSNLKLYIMIHILNIKINIKVTVFGVLLIEKTEDSSVPHAVISEGHLYVKSSESTDRAIYVHSELSVSDYISILMENCPNNLFLIAYV